MLKKLGFRNTWIKWNRSFLESSSISILVNRSPSKQFQPTKGQRQGDPLAPSLFLIVAKGLVGVMRVTEQKGLYDGIRVGLDQIEDNVYSCYSLSMISFFVRIMCKRSKEINALDVSNLCLG